MSRPALTSATSLVQALVGPEADRPVVVDCRFALADLDRGERAWREATIPTAAYAHLDRDLSGEIVPGKTGRHPLPSPELAAQKLGALGIGDGQRVVAFDDAGGCYAARVWWMLRWLGHDAVQVLDGGWQAWTQAGGERAPGVALPAQTLEARVRPEMAIDANTLAILREGMRLVDARAPERFAGDHEPIDSEGGHIPGAENLHWKQNLDGEGRMRSPAELKTRFAQLFDSHAPQELVNYCGSGVTACHNLLAMHHAGLYGAVLFPGSWSGWLVDPKRPRAKPSGA